MTDYVANALSKVGINAKSPTNSYSSTTQGAGAAKEDEKQNATEILTHNQYKTKGLEKDALSPSALTQFRTWFQDAIDHSEIPEPEAMTISTVSVQETENGTKLDLLDTPRSPSSDLGTEGGERLSDFGAREVRVDEANCVPARGR